MTNYAFGNYIFFMVWKKICVLLLENWNNLSFFFVCYKTVGNSNTILIDLHNILRLKFIILPVFSMEVWYIVTFSISYLSIS